MEATDGRLPSQFEDPNILGERLSVSEAKGKLDKFFVPTTGHAGTIGPSRKLVDHDIHHITLLLEIVKPQWSGFPRLYIVLRKIGHLDILDTFVAEGITDLWFPFTMRLFPRTIDSDICRAFVQSQWIVMTKAINLEKGSEGLHEYFAQDEPLPFESREVLGSGSFGTVDKVWSRLSHVELARKRIRRGTKFVEAREKMTAFEKEVANLKRLRHKHIVQLVGSYTDPTYTALLFSPVADCNLAQFLISDAQSVSKTEIILGFFGCLATGLLYMHKNSVRHKDIKPENILIKGDTVLYTDFGIALDWDESGHSTTQDSLPIMTRRYGAPELFEDCPRNSSTDIWALGCVFLEMIGATRGHSLEEFRKFLSGFGSRSTVYCMNQDGVETWMDQIRTGTESKSKDAPLEWIREMLKSKPDSRPTAQNLLREIERVTASESSGNYIGACCTENMHAPKGTKPQSTDQPKALSEGMKGLSLQKTLVPQSLKAVPLFAAVMAGDLNRVQTLIDDGIDIQSEDYFGRTALHKAAEASKLEIAALLLENNANINGKDSQGNTPLYLAASLGHDSLVKLLIEKGADVSIQNGHSLTALHSAANYKHPSCAKMLIDAGSDVDARNSDGCTPLIYCAQFGSEETARILLQAGADPNAPFQLGRTAVHHCAQWGQDRILALILEAGGNANKIDNDSVTPLMIAVEKDELNCTRVLLEHGADPEHKGPIGRNTFHRAAADGRLPQVQALINSGAQIDSRSTETATALIMAAAGGHLPVVQFLLDHGADMNIRVNNGSNALIYAAMGGNPEVVELLISNGMDLRTRNIYGETALHVAARKGHLEAAAVLLGHGADIKSLTTSGATALALAIGNGHEEMAGLLFLAEGRAASNDVK